MADGQSNAAAAASIITGGGRVFGSNWFSGKVKQEVAYV